MASHPASGLVQSARHAYGAFLISVCKNTKTGSSPTSYGYGMGSRVLSLSRVLCITLIRLFESCCSYLSRLGRLRRSEQTVRLSQPARDLDVLWTLFQALPTLDALVGSRLFVQPAIEHL
jgi:hypothetical protein